MQKHLNISDLYDKLENDGYSFNNNKEAFVEGYIKGFSVGNEFSSHRPVWHNQLEAKPEVELGYSVYRDYKLCTNGTIFEPDGKTSIFVTHNDDMHYVTDEVLLCVNGIYYIDFRKKFDSKDEWMWDRFEGCEKNDDIYWTEIPKFDKEQWKH